MKFSNDNKTKNQNDTNVKILLKHTRCNNTNGANALYLSLSLL